MNRRHLLLAPTVVLCVLVIALAVAGTAAAEIRAGSATAPANSAIAGEFDLIEASVYYDSSTGTIATRATTRDAPGPTEGVFLNLVLFSAQEPCAAATETQTVYPLIRLAAPYIEEEDFPDNWQASEQPGEGFNEALFGPLTKSVVDSTTAFAAITPKAIDKPYNCVLAGVFEGENKLSTIIFPLAGPPPATEPSSETEETGATRMRGVSPPTVTRTPAVTPGPGALSIASQKPLKLKAGAWKTVKVKVTNTGASATAQGSLKVKAPKGVSVKPATQPLPGLAPGDSWTISVQVELTAKAKPKSTLSLSASAAGLTGTGSLALKLKQ
jgi:hypothetical protein